MHYAMKQGCLYSKFSPDSAWYSFYHDDTYSSGSGPSKTSQKLALWHNNLCADWPYLGLKGMRPEDIQNHYKCSDIELAAALCFIKQFFVDVEERFV